MTKINGRRAPKPAVTQLDIAYTRVSTNEQRRRQTIDAQRSEVQRWCDYAAVTPTWLADDGTPGDLPFEQRPDGARLLRLLADGQVGTVVVLKIDRLGRSALEILRVVEAIRRAGARLVSIKENIDLATPTGSFFLNVLAAFAELERSWITERTTAGRRAKAEQGKLLPTWKALYGYQWRDRAAGQLEPDPLTAPVVVRVFRDTLAGATLGEIAAALTRENVPAPGGKHWHRTNVRNILLHPYYAGDAAAWRWVVRHPGASSSAPRPPEEWIRLPPGTVPALVDAAIWAAAQVRLQRNRTRRRSQLRDSDLGLLRSGVARCGVCERAMVAVGWRPNRTPFYACSHANYAIAALDAWVWQHVRHFLRHETDLIREQAGQPQVDDQRAQLDRQLAEIDRRQRNLWAEVAHAGGNPILREQIAALDARRRDIEVQRSAYAHGDRLVAEQRSQEQEYLARCRAAAELADTDDIQERRRLLEQTGASVHVWPRQHAPRVELRLGPALGPTVTYQL